MTFNIKNQRILITGMTGFVGRTLGKRLDEQGAKVYGVARGSEIKRKILNSDIMNFRLLDDYVKSKKIEVIIHLAGESLVEKGQVDPFTTFKVNTEGTLNILEIARKNKVNRVIVASTSHVYGKNKVPYYEGYMPRPSRPYETSKACTDLIAQSYAETFNLPVLIPRFVNIYGPGDLNFTRLIPKTLKSVITGNNPEMWGGNAMREYLFIDDAVDAYIKLLSVDVGKVGSNRVFNIGSGEVISVKELINKIIDLAGINAVISKVDDKREMEISSQYVSTKKSKKILDWGAKVKLDEGLLKTIAWYKEFFYNKLSFDENNLLKA